MDRTFANTSAQPDAAAALGQERDAGFLQCGDNLGYRLVSRITSPLQGRDYASPSID